MSASLSGPASFTPEALSFPTSSASHQCLMNATALSILLVLFLIVPAASTLAFEESNESPDVLHEAETQVQAKLDGFDKTNRTELLTEARKVAFSLNPRQRTGPLSSLDEGSLRLQIKVLLAIQKARDPHYDP